MDRRSFELSARWFRKTALLRTTLLGSVLILSSASGATPESLIEQLKLFNVADRNIKAWPELQSSAADVFRGDETVYFCFADSEVGQSVTFPRLNNVLAQVYWLGDPARNELRLSQTPQQWTVVLADPPADVSRPVVVMQLRETPWLPTRPYLSPQHPDGSVEFEARHAVVHGEKLQFEPQAHKNTVGYWVNPGDWAEWHLEIDRPGHFDVDILQGCGRGQGGSRVELSVAGQSRLEFSVIETGHFQCFQWRRIGRLTIAEPGTQRLQVKPMQLAKNAVMDLRRVRLSPVKETATPRPLRPPNVLLFYSDDQGTLDAGCYGSRDLFTPNIDGLAATGVRFTQAYAHTVCCPSRALLLTGRHPQRAGVNRWTQGNAKDPRPGVNMRLDEVTLAEELRSAGYRTALFGKWHLGAAATHGPTRQGFEQFFGHRGGFIDNYSHFFLHGTGFHDLYEGTTEVFRRDEYFPDLMTDAAVKFIEQNRQSPFLLFVAFNLPHYPEQPDGNYRQFYQNHREPRRSYAKVLSATDHRVGAIMQAIDRLQLRDDTIVIYMSDNGHSTENFRISVDNHASGRPRGENYGANGGGGNTGRWRGSKGSFFEGGLRVPAIISYRKRLPAGVAKDQVITSADWMPTVLDLCGLKPTSTELDGASLLPVILENAPTHHQVLHWQWFDRWAVREGDWKLIHDRSLATEEVFLASLRDEQPERTNHAQQFPEVVERLQSLHREWAEDVFDDSN